MPGQFFIKNSVGNYKEIYKTVCDNALSIKLRTTTCYPVSILLQWIIIFTRSPNYLEIYNFAAYLIDIQTLTLICLYMQIVWPLTKKKRERDSNSEISWLGHKTAKYGLPAVIKHFIANLLLLLICFVALPVSGTLNRLQRRLLSFLQASFVYETQ